VDIIVSHARTDFDAFASMLMANKLFPEAVPVLPSTVIYKLKEFVSLYRDVADFKNIRYLRKLKKPVMDNIIVVDTKKQGQLQEFAPFLSQARNVSIFDHHPPTFDDLAVGSVEQFPYGANTTGLFLKINAQGIVLSPPEATIAMLGIYADTGNLTYPGTTPEDALAVSLLLGLQADLQTVNQYLRPYYDPDQRYVFRKMLSLSQEMDMEGYRVVLVKYMLKKPMPGISTMLGQVGDMLGADAILGVFSVENKPGVQIVVQSLVPEIDAGKLAGHFGGGGHHGAAAALIAEADLAEATAALMNLLTDVPLPTTKVHELMATDVFTVPPDLRLDDTAQLLRQKGIRGAPVINGSGELVGIISLRDVEKAKDQNLLRAPTSAFMSHKIVTLEPNAPLVTARKMVSSFDIGHIPVVENSKMVGIISRSDIMAALNGGAIPRPHPLGVQ
jgi:tRNA nucleotidyltransferase (CCA-adding enzyme)